MTETCETVQVKREPSPKNPTGVVIINKSDLTTEDVLADGPTVAPPTAPDVVPEVVDQAPAPAPWAKPA